MQNLVHSNSIAVKGQKKINAFLVKVKSQEPFFISTAVELGVQSLCLCHPLVLA